MSDDLLITPGSRKLEIKDSSGNIDAKLETDASGNLNITNAGGDIAIGDTTSDIFVGDGTNNIDIVFEQSGEIRGTSGVTITLGASGSSVAMATDLALGGNDITNVGTLTAANLNITGTTTTVSSTNTTISDSIIELNSGLTGANTNDIGFIFERGSTGNNAGFVWDESADRFTVFTSTDTASSDTVNTGSVANFQAGSYYGNGANLTSLNASNLASGTISTNRINQPTSGNWWSGGIPIVATDGVMEIGKYIDFHNTDTTTADFDTRLYSSGSNQLTINGSGRILTTGDEGSGNGLDADTLDGQEGTYYRNASNLNAGTVSTDRLPAAAISYQQSTDDRDMKPSTSGIHNVQAIKPFFSSYAGMTGSANTTYVDVIAIDTYSDSSGGGPSAITFKKGNSAGNPEMHIWHAGWNATTWSTGQRVFADNYHPNADTWTTARTITLGGDLSGNVSINGSANVTLTATVSDDSHNHVIGNVDGLQTALDAKLAKTGGTMAGNIAMGNYNITGVNQLEINDPGEGIVFKQGSSGDMVLKIIDDSSDNILQYSGTSAVFDVQGNITLTGTVDGVDIAARNSVLTSTTTTANAALPKAGGTMTGTLNMNSNNVQNARLSGSQTYLPGHAYSLTHDGTNVYWHIGSATGSTNKVLNLRIYNSSNNYILNQWSTSGLSLYGNLTLSGTVDGRDVAADGTKLDTIDTNADVTPSWVPSSNPTYATQSYVGTQISNLVDSSPSALNTLNELAAAINDDASFSTTITNSIATKAPIANPTFTGEVNIPNKLRHDGDTDTYLQFHAANQARIVAGNAEVTEWRSDRMQMNNKSITFPAWTNFAETALSGFAYNALNAPIHINSTGVGSTDKYLPFLQGSATHDQGYRTSYVLGGFKKATTGAAWGDGQSGFFLAMGNNDNNPTTEFRFSYDGHIWHTTGGSSTYIDLGAASNQQQFATDGTVRFKLDTAGGSFMAGNELTFFTSGGSERGFLKATDTNDEHFIIATSGGEDIAFKDNGLSGTTNMIVRGDGSVWIRGAIANGTIAYSQVTGTPTVPTNNNQLTNGAGYITSASLDGLTGKTSGTGTYSTSSHLQSGRGSGGVALTINDGYGNANVTFNHLSGVPEQNGQAARIEVNTDGTSTAGNMAFEVSSSDVTSGSAVSLTSAMTIHPTAVDFPQYVRHMGDTDTYVQFTANRVRIFAGGSSKFDSNNTYLTSHQDISGKVDIGSGFSANRVLTAANSDTADGEANLTFDGSTLAVNASTTMTKSSSDQNTSEDSASIPDTTGAEIIKFQGGYTNGQYTTEFTKVDRSGNLPLYVRQSKGTANSFSNIARFGDHGQTNGTDVFAVFGNAKVGGNLTINEYLYHGGDTNTYLRFTGDAITLRAGGTDMVNIIEGTDDYVEIAGRLQVRDGVNLKMFHSSGTSGGSIHMPRAGMITFYGDQSTHHAIGSRNQGNGEADDLLITSYGAVYIDLDSNSNNTSGADFIVGKHNSTSANLFSVNGENGKIGQNGKNIITSSGTSLIIGDVDENDDFDSVKLSSMSGTASVDVQDAEVYVAGGLNIQQYLRHTGDSNTHLQFTGDRVRLTAGNVEMIDCVEGGTDYVDIIDRVRVTSGGDMICEGDVVAFTSTTVSDINQKENIKPIKDAVSKVKRLAGVTFDWKKDKKKSAGIIAQDVEKVLPEIVKQKEDRSGEEFKSVDYNGIIGLLVEGMKEQQEEIEKLKKLLEDK